jgi:3-methyladenine DNA glycosylase/8-oxoguanine DNA glycosylase
VTVPQTTAALDAGLTFGPLAHTMGGASSRVVDGEWHHAMNSPEGAVAFALDVDSWRWRAWGPGRDWIAPRFDAMTEAEPPPVPAGHPLVATLQHRLPGLRLVALGSVADLAPARIIGQRVTTVEARQSWRKLVWRFGEPAPGPLKLRLPPHPLVLATLPDWEWKRLGVEAQRARTIQRFARDVGRLEAVAHDATLLGRRLRAMRGIGPWTSEFLTHFVCSDPDAVPIGDWHMPSHVAFALAGERQATDERMLELLQPFRPQRARVWRMIVAAARKPPRRAPRARILGLLELERTRRYA